MKKRSHIGELGGFAESPEVLEEGTEEAQEAFNFCLASDYIAAIYAEDFESLGFMDSYLLDQVLMWYEVGGGVLTDEEMYAIRSGSVITRRNRTFVEAVLEDRNDCLANIFILNGNHNPKLYALCVSEDEWHGLLNSDDDMTRDEYLEFLRDVFNSIEDDYSSFDNESKIRMLSSLKTNLSSIRYSKGFGKISISDVGSYQFIKDIKRG